MMGNVSTHARPASSTTRATEASLFLVRLICLGTQHEAHPAPAIESWRCNCTLSPSSAPTAILWHLSETLCETRDDGGPNPFLTQLGEQYSSGARRRLDADRTTQTLWLADGMEGAASQELVDLEPCVSCMRGDSEAGHVHMRIAQGTVLGFRSAG
jgi:hypothetical protein